MRIAWTAGVCLLTASTPVWAQTATPTAAATITHVRGTTPDIRMLIASVAEQSRAFRDLLDRLEQSTVIVYVRTAPLPSTALDGRLGFLEGRMATGPRRLVIELTCRRPLLAHAATLAHELRHAVEIADAPWVVGPATMAQYYAQIGIPVGAAGTRSAFETFAAQAAAARVRREMRVAPRTTATR